MTQARPSARQLLTVHSERLLATRYAGQIRAVVREPAVTIPIDWSDLCDRIAEIRDGLPEPGGGDLGGQGLTWDELRAIDDIALAGEWL